jgi:hypothetical protein
LPDGLSGEFPVQPLLKKDSVSPLTQINSISIAVPSRSEGRFAIVTDVRRDAVDADDAKDEGARRGRRSRVVRTPRRWRQVGGTFSADDGGKKARSPRRARRKPLKPLRGECRAFSGVTVVTNARVYYHYTRGCGRIGRPAFPAPSPIRGREVSGKPRAHSAARSRNCGFGCVGSIQVTGCSLVIARSEATKQSSFLLHLAKGWMASRSQSSSGALRQPVGSQ